MLSALEIKEIRLGERICQGEMWCFLKGCPGKLPREDAFEQRLERNEGVSKVHFEERELQAMERAQLWPSGKQVLGCLSLESSEAGVE